MSMAAICFNYSVSYKKESLFLSVRMLPHYDSLCEIHDLSILHFFVRPTFSHKLPEMYLHCFEIFDYSKICSWFNSDCMESCDSSMSYNTKRTFQCRIILPWINEALIYDVFLFRISSFGKKFVASVCSKRINSLCSLRSHSFFFSFHRKTVFFCQC